MTEDQIKKKKAARTSTCIWSTFVVEWDCHPEGEVIAYFGASEAPPPHIFVRCDHAPAPTVQPVHQAKAKLMVHPGTPLRWQPCEDGDYWEECIIILHLIRIQDHAGEPGGGWRAELVVRVIFLCNADHR